MPSIVDVAAEPHAVTRSVLPVTLVSEWSHATPQEAEAAFVDHAAIKRERRFRNAMRARGGRVRTNEEMRGVCARMKEQERCNLAIASTDEEVNESGAWRVRWSRMAHLNDSHTTKKEAPF